MRKALLCTRGLRWFFEAFLGRVSIFWSTTIGARLSINLTLNKIAVVQQLRVQYQNAGLHWAP